MGETALTFPNYNAAAKETLTTPVCAVAKVYEKVDIEHISGALLCYCQCVPDHVGQLHQHRPTGQLQPADLPHGGRVTASALHTAHCTLQTDNATAVGRAE